MSENYAICTFPFNAAQISMQGDVYVCCPPWSSSYSFGNIYEQSFDEIWNGDRAREFRRQFINNDYKYCKLDLCVKDCAQKIIPSETVEKPKTFIFCYDTICNVKCIFCRSCHQKQDLSYFDEHMDEIISNMLENAQNVVLSGVGEALFSPHSRKLIKRISEMFPNIKFSLISNGILCDEENLKELGIIDKLLSITVSLHAVKKSTYDKLVKNGDFDKVMENLKFLSQLKQKGKLDRFILNFVVTSCNYREMSDYIKMAEKLGATVGFLELLKLETNEDVYNELNILNENHPKYNDFVRVMKNPIFRSGKCTINDTMLNLRPIDKPNKIVKYFSIFITNILIIFLLLYILNFLIYFRTFKNDINNNNFNDFRSILTQYKNFMSQDVSRKNTYDILINDKDNWYRRIENKTSSKPSIVLFGCSFVWGTNLEDNKTFSYQLGKLTKRPIYNRALGGWGVQHMLYQLQQDEFYNIITSKSLPPQYVIYTFFRGHYTRIVTSDALYSMPCYLVFYKHKKNGEFVLKNRSFFNSKIIIHHFIIHDIIIPLIENKKSYQSYIDEIMFDYLMASKKELNKHLPNTKFVIFFYDEPYTQDIIRKLEENGFIIISNNDMGINQKELKYILSDRHPSALYWEEATPKIIKKLHL